MADKRLWTRQKFYEEFGFWPTNEELYLDYWEIRKRHAALIWAAKHRKQINHLLWYGPLYFGISFFLLTGIVTAIIKGHFG